MILLENTQTSFDSSTVYVKGGLTLWGYSNPNSEYVKFTSTNLTIAMIGTIRQRLQYHLVASYDRI